MPVHAAIRFLAHVSMPGASDEILSLAFAVVAVLTGWWILKQDG